MWVATNPTPRCPPPAASLPATGRSSAPWPLRPGCGPAPPWVSRNRRSTTSRWLASASRRLDVLAIGDRLDTDILGAANAGLDSLWVLTGVDDLVSFARAPGRPAPTYAARDLRALDRPPMVASVGNGTVVCGSMRLSVDWAAGELTVVEGDDPDALVGASTAALVHGRDVESVSVDVLVRVAKAAATLVG